MKTGSAIQLRAFVIVVQKKMITDIFSHVRVMRYNVACYSHDPCKEFCKL